VVGKAIKKMNTAAFTVHTMSVEEAYKHLRADKKGLTNVEAAKRLETYGPNELESEPEKSIWARIAEQLEDELVIILLVAAVISFIIALTGKQATFLCNSLILCV
jgi:Ca2+-transporting ATPase